MKDLLKIRFVYPQFHKRGGVERYIVELAYALKRKGQAVTLACSKFDDNLTAGFPLEKIPSFGPGKIMRQLTYLMFERLRRTREPTIQYVQGSNGLRPDIVQAHSCHKAWFFESLRSLKPLTKAWILKLCNPIHYLAIAIETYQYNWRQPKRIVAVSNIVKQQITKLFRFPEEKILVVHCGVNTEEFRPTSDEMKKERKKQFRVAPKKRVLSFVGHEFRRKNLATLIKALPQLGSSYHVLVAGNDQEQPFQKLANDLGVGLQITFLGAVSPLANLYAASDVFVFPTTHDAFGLVITEAMAAGLPVITGPEAGASELIVSGSNGIIMTDVMDETELVRHLRSLEEPEANKAMAIAARDTAENYSWDAVAERMMEVYQDVAREMAFKELPPLNPTNQLKDSRSK